MLRHLFWSSRKFCAPDGKTYVWKTRIAVNDLKASASFPPQQTRISRAMMCCDDVMLRLLCAPLAYLPSAQLIDYETKKTVAKIHHTYHFWPSRQKMSLEVTSDAVPALDAIMLSFVMCEEERRDRGDTA